MIITWHFWLAIIDILYLLSACYILFNYLLNLNFNVFYLYLNLGIGLESILLKSCYKNCKMSDYYDYKTCYMYLLIQITSTSQFLLHDTKEVNIWYKTCQFLHFTSLLQNNAVEGSQAIFVRKLNMKFGDIWSNGFWDI